ncbi:hypothetical protein [Actinoplanes aureus]|uniref:DUF2637 domain-containing protein n=1 Tax=Actinoplanes aureus TaxID=2792083 RepID=A0A931FXD6_9ACTN|nr:hypothetical protein [Actinoplanes aureus]MBG0560746.1 hypothetical protein [Actinoplanes aureus]
MTTDLSSLLDRREVIAAGLLLSVVLLTWAGRRLARSSRPDGPLSRIAMIIGLGWSSEAVWELTGRIPGFPAGPRVLLFAVLEILLLVSMIRADRHVREHGWPGRAGTTAWIIAVSMGLVAAAVSHSAAEALLRLAIPLLLTKQWWDGLVGDQAKRPEWATSWRWTPRRFLLWLGAIEPGERDVETVHRERLTQQMTNLEFRRRHGSERQRKRAARRLARLSLAADDTIIDQVRARVDRAVWFEVTHPAEPDSAMPPAVPARQAASVRAARIRHGRKLRTLRVTHLPKPVTAAQPTRQEERQKDEIELVVAAIKSTRPELRPKRLAHLAVTSESTARRVLQRIDGQTPARVNGKESDLVAAGS